MQARHLVLTAILLAAACYAVGLAGPFLFDDGPNFARIEQWLAGSAGWYDAIFGTGSGILSRPVAMASFALNAQLTGMNPYAFKLVNLLVHLACGALVWLCLRAGLRHDQNLQMRASWIAAAVAALWLLHPLHVSTVLYAVQRMAQLSTLFTLAALWAYLDARARLATGDQRRGLLGMFALVPLLTVFGLLSKENAAVVPALCLLAELVWFAGGARPKAVWVFFGLFLLLPALALCVGLGLAPGRLLDGYAQRDFSLGERLLSQGRALVAYLGQLIWPRPAALGLYYDDFAISRGWFAPPSTAIALSTLAIISGVAAALRRKLPAVCFGWFFFLLAHAVESSVVPLELYFEHRNYLPAVGLLLAVVALVVGALDRLAAARRRLAHWLPIVLVAVTVVTLAALTFGKARTWRSLDTIAAEGVVAHPGSLRANLDFATSALHQNRYDHALAAMARLTATPAPRNRLIGHLGTMSVQCLSDGTIDPALLPLAVASAPTQVGLPEYQAFGLLSRVHLERKCRGLGLATLAGSIDTVLESTQAQPATSAAKWRMRMLAAELFQTAGQKELALAQARLAWQPTADTGVGVVLVRALHALGRNDEAEQVLDQMLQRVGRYQYAERVGIEQLRTQLRAAGAAPED